MTRRISAAPTSHRRRALRAAALLPVAALALAGCQWTSTVQTDKPYEPADGRSTKLGGVSVNNLSIVAAKKGEAGTLIGRGTNDTNQAVQVSFDVQGKKAADLTIEPMSSALLTDLEKGTKAHVSGVPADPGSLVDVTITTTGAGSKTLQVPVIAPKPPYASYAPSGAPSQSPASSPTDGPTGAPTSGAPTDAPSGTPTDTSSTSH